MTPVDNTRRLVIGTAGHVDHGKTTLIRAMTGINTDRLKEEQERGLTIDLGFAFLRLPGGAVAGIVDVPGHEKFLKNMLAGASGVDIALLVVAADEGVMPQTREHLEILDLLETPQGVVALTRCDLVDDEWLDVVEEDLRSNLRGTFLANARIVRVSGLTGAGIDDLVREIDTLAERAAPRPVEGPFRLPVDRVFTITGFGTVVTGTLVSGTIRVGDAAVALPENRDTRVRQLEVHGEKQEVVYAGTRVAVNLAGLEVGDLQRGSVLCSPGHLLPTTALDAAVTVLDRAPRPLANRTRVRLHVGSAEVIGRAIVLGADQIGPGERGFVQIRLEKPVATARGDRFVLRFYSPTDLLGGGVIVDPTGARHRRADTRVVERLERKLRGDPVDIMEDTLAVHETGLTQQELARLTGLADRAVAEAAEELAAGGRAVRVSGRLMHTTCYEALASRAAAALAAYHRSHSMRPGMPKEELRAQLGPRVDQRAFQALMSRLSEEGRVVVSEAAVRLPDHQPTLNDRQRGLAWEIEQRYERAGVNPPLESEIEREYGAEAREIVAALVERGSLVRIAPDIVFHADAAAGAEAALREFLRAHGEITVARFRDMIGSSRRYVVPLLIYFDDKKVTRRKGDARVLYR